ncbi:MAG TPA: sugar phosphate isomerase/epimerase family protein [Tepidisphaeraceae bacterium]|nr:sugar phosphate isomerase/epimerase family protein [Tepidisphaeraceae bacterium]
MKFGICTSITNAAAVKAAGWDYVEENVQSLLQGTVTDEAWTNESAANAAVLPVPAANSLVPASLKITGPDVDPNALGSYMETVIRRAATVGIQTLVFGSGAARNVPDGFDRERAVEQITDFVRSSADLAADADIMLVAEPLNRGECNIINTIDEAMQYVREVDRPNFQCLLDTYHLWLEDEPLVNLQAAMPWIKHVHLADKDGRVAPGLSGTADYRPVFKILKGAGYDGLISFEGHVMPDFAVTAPKVLSFIKRQWSEA